MCGYGMPGQLFYNIHVPLNEEDVARSQIIAIMKVIEGKGSMAKITSKLWYVICSTWDWQVKKISSDDYKFVVPSAKDLEFLTKFKEFKWKIIHI